MYIPPPLSNIHIKRFKDCGFEQNKSVTINGVELSYVQDIKVGLSIDNTPKVIIEMLGNVTIEER